MGRYSINVAADSGASFISSPSISVAIPFSSVIASNTILSPFRSEKPAFVLPNEVTRDVWESMVGLTAVAHQEEGRPVVRLPGRNVA